MPVSTMVLSTENILLLGSILLFVSIIASKTSFKTGIPALILFLVVASLFGKSTLMRREEGDSTAGVRLVDGARRAS